MCTCLIMECYRVYSEKGQLLTPLQGFCFLSNSRPIILKNFEKAIVRIIETCYSAQFRFVVKNDGPDPDLEIPN